MPRAKDDMQVNVAGLRRNIKNIAHNYSDAQVKVREATSNDPWGPSSTLMAEIADLTYNVMAFTEIMQMIWKRLNDHGKNWRHVYKALVLMEYLIKTGTEKVAMQCKENIFAIQTLKDFQYMEEGKDQGLNVREKAKQLVILLKDDERLKNERARALKAKERFAQTASSFGSDGALDTPSSPNYPAFGGSQEWSRSTAASAPAGTVEMECARPLTAGEEELQLQLALAMSREEAEKDERRRRSDDVRLQLAISQSQQDFQTPEKAPPQQQSHLLDLLDVNLGSPVAAPLQSQAAALDPWGLPPSPPQRPQLQSSDPWSGSSPPDPWATYPEPMAAPPDPWAPLAVMNKSPINILSSPASDLEEFDAITNRTRASNGTPIVASNNVNNNHHHSNGTSPDPFDLSILGERLPAKKTPQSFLGENSSLVNLDNLIKPSNGTNEQLFNSANPFAVEVQPARPNLFQQPQPRVTINDLKQQSYGLPPLQQQTLVQSTASDPWSVAAPRTSSATPNPFLS